MSEKQTHRKLSGSVRLGQFSTQSGLNDFSVFCVNVSAFLVANRFCV
jgi:hypothetical protein